jgi:hypothetical protein
VELRKVLKRGIPAALRRRFGRDYGNKTEGVTGMASEWPKPIRVSLCESFAYSVVGRSSNRGQGRAAALNSARQKAAEATTQEEISKVNIGPSAARRVPRLGLRKSTSWDDGLWCAGLKRRRVASPGAGLIEITSELLIITYNL